MFLVIAPNANMIINRILFGGMHPKVPVYNNIEGTYL